ncbi:hypothetical protein QR680_006227 [Steinernema hermaphroditum]|uniref:TIL domain-containing protein n=1 Tax=Steinernema hermaphroditum TaxID=289476 RepID=A0AA39LWS3_9BILA|nr:hypothetical protein QR680_006227 [Steinernema hermaphroditum]
MKLPLIVIALFFVSYIAAALPSDEEHKCGENERWWMCPGCESTCGPMQPCYGMCGSPRCQCDWGHARNKKTGKCVPYAECPEENHSA